MAGIGLRRSPSFVRLPEPSTATSPASVPAAARRAAPATGMTASIPLLVVGGVVGGVLVAVRRRGLMSAPRTPTEDDGTPPVT